MIYSSLLILVVVVLGVLFDAARRKRASGVKPFLACVLDALCVFPKLLRVSIWQHDPISIKNIIQNKKKSLNLSDFGGDEQEFIRRYDPLISVGLMRSKAEVSPVGTVVLHMSISERVEQRLQMIDYIKKHPEIKNIQINKPVYVIGFPRTGTTFLHEMLGLHPDVRMHYTWEQLGFIPATHDESLAAQTRDRKERYAKNKWKMDVLNAVTGDEMQSIHRMGYDESEECSTPCGMELPFNIPSIPFMTFAAEEVIALGANDAFPLYKQYLQLLVFQSEHRQGPFTWMLKCPFHLPYLTELIETFPDATIVWTHRNPVECIASACSLYETIMKFSVNSWTIDKRALGQAVMEYTYLALEKATESIRLAAANTHVLHIRYADNIKDPKTTCKQVMTAAGILFSNEYVELLDNYLEESETKRKALKTVKKVGVVHHYTLEEYGLTEKMVLEKFSRYIAKYNL